MILSMVTCLTAFIGLRLKRIKTMHDIIKNEQGRTLLIDSGFRPTKHMSAEGYFNLCKAFAFPFIEHYEFVYDKPQNIDGIDFRKQDSRGIPSITLVDKRNCVPYQKHFVSYAEMEFYMRGFLAAKESRFM